MKRKIWNQLRILRRKQEWIFAHVWKRQESGKRKKTVGIRWQERKEQDEAMQQVEEDLGHVKNLQK